LQKARRKRIVVKQHTALSPLLFANCYLLFDNRPLAFALCSLLSALCKKLEGSASLYYFLGIMPFAYLHRFWVGVFSCSEA
jgi:hypothetical protein